MTARGREGERSKRHFFEGGPLRMFPYIFMLLRRSVSIVSENRFM